MSTQVKFTNSPSGDYVVINNGTLGASTSGAFPGAASPNQSTNWLGIQSDGSCQNFDSTTGATESPSRLVYASGFGQGRIEVALGTSRNSDLTL